MHKTGSTSLQQSLAQVKNPIGWDYISVACGSNMGGALYAMFATEPHRFYWFRRRGSTPGEVAEHGANLRLMLAAAIKASAAENMILSGEALTAIDKPGILALRDFLKPLCDEIRVIGYVRPPVGFKISFFQQLLKHHGVAFDLSSFRLKYYIRFAKFDEVFGQTNVLLRKFDPASFKNQCVVTDFCNQIGIQEP